MHVGQSVLNNFTFLIQQLLPVMHWTRPCQYEVAPLLWNNALGNKNQTNQRFKNTRLGYNVTQRREPGHSRLQLDATLHLFIEILE